MAAVKALGKNLLAKYTVLLSPQQLPGGLSDFRPRQLLCTLTEGHQQGAEKHSGHGVSDTFSIQSHFPLKAARPAQELWRATGSLGSTGGIRTPHTHHLFEM